MPPVVKSLEEILQENRITAHHLSPAIRANIPLTARLPYIAPRQRDENEEPSDPEKEIIEYLKSQGINHEREKAIVVVEEDGMIHVRYADFYFPELDLYIEYNGMEWDEERKKDYKKKNIVYKKNGIRT